MKQLRLIWSMLWRSPARTTLTFLSIVVAFFLFGSLQSIATAFTAGSSNALANRLILMNKKTPFAPVPYAYRDQIAAVDGAKLVYPGLWMGLSYQDPKNNLTGIASEARSVFAVDDRFDVSDAALDAMDSTRTGIIVGQHLMEKYGWSVGDKVPFNAAFRNPDTGEQVWDFDIVGTWTLNTPVAGDLNAETIFGNYSYLDEARQYNVGTVTWFSIIIEDGASMVDVARRIDALFENADVTTKTQSEAQLFDGFSKDVGDVGAIVNAVLLAVTFTLLLVAANAMGQAFSERVPELAVMKTLGFRDGQLALYVIVEALLLCLVAAAVGLLLAKIGVDMAKAREWVEIPGMAMSRQTVLLGMGVAAVIAVLSSAIPAMRSARLQIVDALQRGA